MLDKEVSFPKLHFMERYFFFYKNLEQQLYIPYVLHISDLKALCQLHNFSFNFLNLIIR